MNKFFKKAVSFVLAIAVISSIGCVAFANAEMEHMVFAGYEIPVKSPLTPNRIYNEVINGVYTGKTVLEPVTPTWQPEWYEGVYPYAGYSRMYLDGNRQDITIYNELFPQWEERRQDYMWELKAPYYIYERQQTLVPQDNGEKEWTWDFGNEAFGIPDTALLTKTVKEAVVLDQGYKYYGFGAFDKNGEDLTGEEAYMYKNFLAPGYENVYDASVNVWKNLMAIDEPMAGEEENYGLLTVNSLSKKDPYTNKYVVTDEMIADAIPVVYTKYVTAKFNRENDLGLATKYVADEYLANYKKDWGWDVADGFAVTNDAYITWTQPTYEMEGPRYYQYQLLVINNIVMDGSGDTPRIVRYTGGFELPEVEWRFVFFQHKFDEEGNELPHDFDAVERKYVNGVAAVDAEGNPVYRIPTLGVDNRYFKVNGYTIEVWKVNADGEHTILGKHDNWAGSLGGLIDAYANGSYNYKGRVPAEAYKMLP